VLGSDTASAFLIGRLAQEGRTPLAMLKASPGRWRGVGGVHVFAVDPERLWLVQPRLLGDPAIAWVPLAEVHDMRMHTRPRPGAADVVRLDIELAGGTLRYTAQDDADTCGRFLDALRGRTARP